MSVNGRAATASESANPSLWEDAALFPLFDDDITASVLGAATTPTVNGFSPESTALRPGYGQTAEHDNVNNIVYAAGPLQGRTVSDLTFVGWGVPHFDSYAHSDAHALMSTTDKTDDGFIALLVADYASGGRAIPWWYLAEAGGEVAGDSGDHLWQAGDVIQYVGRMGGGLQSIDVYNVTQDKVVAQASKASSATISFTDSTITVGNRQQDEHGYSSFNGAVIYTYIQLTRWTDQQIVDNRAAPFAAWELADNQTADLSIDEPQDGTIVQRIDGSAAVTITGSCDADQTVQARVVDESGSPVIDWTNVSAASGVYNAVFTVPEGGWYTRQVRYADSSDRVNGANRFGVGILIGCIGQSNLEHWWQGYWSTTPVDGQALTPDAHIRSYQGGSWSTFAPGDDTITGADGAIAFANELYSNLDTPVPVGLVNRAVGGSALTEQAVSPDNDHHKGYWLHQDAGSNYANFIADVDALGGVLEQVIWIQGERDSKAGVSGAVYKAGLGTLFDWVRADVEGNNGTVPVMIGPIGIGDEDYYVADDWESTRTVERQFAAENADVTLGPNSIDLPRLTSQGHHTRAGYQLMGRRYARVSLAMMGEPAGYNSPVVDSIEPVSNTQTRVNIAHGGGDDFTPASGITGFTVDGAAATADRESASSIVLTHDAAGESRRVSYEYNDIAIPSAPFADNAPVSMDLLYYRQTRESAPVDPNGRAKSASEAVNPELWQDALLFPLFDDDTTASVLGQDISPQITGFQPTTTDFSAGYGQTAQGSDTARILYDTTAIQGQSYDELTLVVWFVPNIDSKGPRNDGNQLAGASSDNDDGFRAFCPLYYYPGGTAAPRWRVPQAAGNMDVSGTSNHWNAGDAIQYVGRLGGGTQSFDLYNATQGAEIFSDSASSSASVSFSDSTMSLGNGQPNIDSNKSVNGTLLYGYVQFKRWTDQQVQDNRNAPFAIWDKIATNDVPATATIAPAMSNIALRRLLSRAGSATDIEAAFGMASGQRINTQAGTSVSVSPQVQAAHGTLTGHVFDSAAGASQTIAPRYASVETQVARVQAGQAVDIAPERFKLFLQRLTVAAGNNIPVSVGIGHERATLTGQSVETTAGQVVEIAARHGQAATQAVDAGAGATADVQPHESTLTGHALRARLGKSGYLTVDSITITPAFSAAIDIKPH